MPDKDDMLMNWPERVWIYSPIRALFQKREADKWLDLVGKQKIEKALEIGCGLGRGAKILVDKMDFHHVAAFDLEEKLVRWSVKLRPSSLQDKVDFFVADAQNLPFSTNCFDAVVNYGIIHHVNDWEKCIREISRTLKPGGLFYFEEIYPPLYANPIMKRVVKHPVQNRFTREDFLEALERNGLELSHGTDTSSRFGIVGVARRL